MEQQEILQYLFSAGRHYNAVCNDEITAPQERIYIEMMNKAGMFLKLVPASVGILEEVLCSDAVCNATSWSKDICLKFAECVLPLFTKTPVRLFEFINYFIMSNTGMRTVSTYLSKRWCLRTGLVKTCFQMKISS
jgi:hypothetical protein